MTDQKTNHVLGAFRLSAGLGWFKRVTCLHEFDLNDLRKTETPKPAKPEKNYYKAWEKYHMDFYTSDYVRKAVMWPCCKCGKIFYAHCGLDIYSYGKPKKRMPNV